ncbi:heme-binding protein [Gammaproteobacteria bacterium]|nr:heme-binding protein [Gammaproteobacteria bacterium]
MIKNPGEINLDEALNICKEALKKGRELDLMPLTVTVIDIAGVTRATLSEEGSSLMRPEMAYAKAWSCLALNVSTNTMRDMFESMPRLAPAARGIQTMAGGKLFPTPGGMLIQKDGKNIGAVGVTGDVSDQDEICAIAGIESSHLTPGHKSI